MSASDTDMRTGSTCEPPQRSGRLFTAAFLFDASENEVRRIVEEEVEAGDTAERSLYLAQRARFGQLRLFVIHLPTADCTTRNHTFRAFAYSVQSA